MRIDGTSSRSGLDPVHGIRAARPAEPSARPGARTRTSPAESAPRASRRAPAPGALEVVDSFSKLMGAGAPAARPSGVDVFA